jgi:hypothetical protein
MNIRLITPHILTCELLMLASESSDSPALSQIVRVTTKNARNIEYVWWYGGRRLPIGPMRMSSLAKSLDWMSKHHLAPAVRKWKRGEGVVCSAFRIIDCFEMAQAQHNQRETA